MVYAMYSCFFNVYALSKFSLCNINFNFNSMVSWCVSTLISVFCLDESQANSADISKCCRMETLHFDILLGASSLCNSRELDRGFAAPDLEGVMRATRDRNYLGRNDEASSILDPLETSDLGRHQPTFSFV